MLIITCTWIALNWTEFRRIDLNWIQLNSLALKWHRRVLNWVGHGLSWTVIGSAKMNWVGLDGLIWIGLSWVELTRLASKWNRVSWLALNWIGLEFSFIALEEDCNWILRAPIRLELSWYHLTWLGSNWLTLHCCELNWLKLDCMYWIGMCWIGLDRIDLNSIQLFCFPLNWNCIETGSKWTLMNWIDLVVSDWLNRTGSNWVALNRIESNWIEHIGMCWRGYDQIRLDEIRFDSHGMDSGKLSVIELYSFEMVLIWTEFNRVDLIMNYVMLTWMELKGIRLELNGIGCIGLPWHWIGLGLDRNGITWNGLKGNSVYRIELKPIGIRSTWIGSALCCIELGLNWIDL